MTNMTTKILVRAREILEDPDRWTTLAPARTNLGSACMPLDKHAVCWCSGGAIEKAARDVGGHGYDVLAARDVLTSVIRSGACVVVWNDCEASHIDVLETFNRAIERSENEDRG